jgi:CRP/FNR family transcriptional regulator
LLQLAADYGRVTREGIRLEFPLTHVLLAEMVGSERETVTRAVEQLEAEGFLSRSGRKFVLHVEPTAVGPRPAAPAGA